MMDLGLFSGLGLLPARATAPRPGREEEEEEEVMECGGSTRERRGEARERPRPVRSPARARRPMAGDRVPASGLVSVVGADRDRTA
jgi:hypothetical protein